MMMKFGVATLGALAIAATAPAGAAAACSTSIQPPTVSYVNGGEVQIWGAVKLGSGCDHAVALFMDRNGDYATITPAFWFVGNVNGTAYSSRAWFKCSDIRGRKFRSGLLRRGGSWTKGPIITPCR